MRFIPNAGKVVARSLAVLGAITAQAIPFGLQALGNHIAAIPNIDDGTRSMMQLGLTVVLTPLGRAVAQDLTKRFPPEAE